MLVSSTESHNEWRYLFMDISVVPTIAAYEHLRV